MRTLKALGPALLVSIAFSWWMVNMLGSGWLFAISFSSVIGFGIFAVVRSRPTEEDRLADEAWKSAVADLPPVSDRRALEQSQEAIPGPSKKATQARVKPRPDEATQGAVQ
jgi:hypothetical protein